jgi:hypothetical protein
MSLAGALAEIASATSSPEQRRHVRFRATQRALDALIGEVEIVVGSGQEAVPEPSRRRRGCSWQPSTAVCRPGSSTALSRAGC